MAKRFNYHDDFESVYLRHDYMKRVTAPLDVQDQWVREFQGEVKKTALFMYSKLRPNFDKVGFDYEDIISIATVYMVSYMSIYSSRSNPKLRDRYTAKLRKNLKREPSNEEIDTIDKYNLINFLKQKLQRCYVVCGGKARNITVGDKIKRTFAKTSESVDACDEEIVHNYKKLGYRRVTMKELKDIKVKARMDGVSKLTDSDGFDIIEIEIFDEGIDGNDYIDMLFRDRDDVYTCNPEELSVRNENKALMSEFTNKFNNLDNEGKINILKEFIKKHKGRGSYKVELTEARKILKKLKNVVSNSNGQA